MIGIDFDNTIVCYDNLFVCLARERGLLPEQSFTSKGQVRDYLRSIGKEDEWTEMQGIAYGPRIEEAEPFPGIKEFMKVCTAQRVPFSIISHKTQHPFIGPQYDLHAAARRWLCAHHFHDDPAIALAPASVYLELTKESKLKRVGTIHCTYFIDDLPEILSEPAFPSATKKILFDPGWFCPDRALYQRARSWHDVQQIIFSVEGAPRC